MCVYETVAGQGFKIQAVDFMQCHRPAGIQCLHLFQSVLQCFSFTQCVLRHLPCAFVVFRVFLVCHYSTWDTSLGCFHLSSFTQLCYDMVASSAVVFAGAVSSLCVADLFFIVGSGFFLAEDLSCRHDMGAGAPGVSGPWVPSFSLVGVEGGR